MSSISEHSDSEHETRKRTNKSELIAFLPITAGQKHAYNVKGLQSQMEVFFATVRASLVDAGIHMDSLDASQFQTVMMNSMNQAYAAPMKRKVARSAWNFFNEEQHQQYKGKHMTMPEVTKEIAQKWREMSEEEKQPYFTMHYKAKAELAKPAEAAPPKAKSEDKAKPSSKSAKDVGKKETKSSSVKSTSAKKPAKGKK
jgi:hypothetical protein